MKVLDSFIRCFLKGRTDKNKTYNMDDCGSSTGEGEMPYTEGTILCYNNYLRLRSIAGNEPWISVPNDPGPVVGVDRAHASLLRIEKNNANSTEPINSGGQVLLRGTGGIDGYMHIEHVAGAEVKALEGGGAAVQKSILVIRKVKVPGEHSGDSVIIEEDGVPIRVGEYVVLRDSKGNTNAPQDNQRLRLDAQGAAMKGVATWEAATPFRIEELWVRQPENQPPAIEWISLGSMDGPPCSKIEWTNEGWFGLPSPTVRWGSQRFTAYAAYDKIAFDQAANTIRNCLLAAAGSATLASIIGTPGTAWPAFVSSFTQCATNAGLEAQLRKIPELKIDSACNYH